MAWLSYVTICPRATTGAPVLHVVSTLGAGLANSLFTSNLAGVSAGSGFICALATSLGRLGAGFGFSSSGGISGRAAIPVRVA